MIKKIALLYLIVAVSFTAVQAQSFNKAKLDSLFDAISANNKGMGSLAISKDGKVIYQRATGYSLYNVDNKLSANPKTKYRIGSISKMFTGSMIFQLIEEGKLNLAAPLSTYYPQIPNAAKITIAMMLQHCSGLHNFTNDAVYQTYMLQPKTEQEMVAIFAAQQPDFEPDAKSNYSNTNFVLLGYIIEKLTKKTYAENLRERIVAKAGLTDTYYGGKINAANNEANSYWFSTNTWVPATETNMSIPGGAGAVISTPTDLTKFVEALFAGKLISKEHLAMMQNIRDNYGMAMFHYPVFTYNGYGHTGGIDGFGSQVIHFPAEYATVAYCSNGANYDIANIILAAASALFDKPYVIPTFKTVTVDNNVLDKYTGVYSAANFPLKIMVTNNSGVLWAQGTGQGAFQLETQSATVFKFAAAGITLEFNAEKSEMILMQAGRSYTLTKEK